MQLNKPVVELLRNSTGLLLRCVTPTAILVEMTPVQGVSLGVLVGVLFIFVSGKLLSGSDDAKFAILEGVDVRRALLIILVMTVHSFSEGIGIGT